MAKNSEHIRIKTDDKKTWKEYCKAIGVSSPELFSKIMKSENLKLNERILEERKKQEAVLIDLKRRFGVK